MIVLFGQCSYNCIQEYFLVSKLHLLTLLPLVISLWLGVTQWTVTSLLQVTE